MITMESLISQLNQDQSAPVDQWNPEFCGDIDMRIDREGQWFYEGSLITRQRLVELFATVLKLEDSKYFLVTPGEKVGIQVESTPFNVCRAELMGDTWMFENNLRQQILLDVEHPLHFQEEDPFVVWRRNLPARIRSNVMYQLQLHALDNGGLIDDVLWLTSADTKFKIGEA